MLLGRPWGAVGGPYIISKHDRYCENMSLYSRTEVRVHATGRSWLFKIRTMVVSSAEIMSAGRKLVIRGVGRNCVSAVCTTGTGVASRTAKVKVW